ncbi:MAG: hypothetical protein V3R37_09900 [Rhodospirillales bacterium]
MDKRPRLFTAERRNAEITGASIGASNEGLMDAFRDLSAYVQDEGEGISQANIDALFD